VGGAATGGAGHEGMGAGVVKIGVPRELKDSECRVALTPAGAQELVLAGHDVFVECGAGTGSAMTDDEYAAAGATLLPDPDEVWAEGDLLLKVKEPIAAEYGRLRADQVLFTYLHLAADRTCAQALLDAGVTALGYETVQQPDGSLPLLAPMSEVAGRMAPQVGAQFLEKFAGGRGVLLGGVSGVPAGKVVVLGAGVAGMNAAVIALGMQAEVLLLDKNIAKLREADRIYQGHCQTLASNRAHVERSVADADLVIGAVLVAGARAPTLVTDAMVETMKPGSVLVDISVDQGGCFESTRPTTHSEPVYPVHGSLFYCVANMPGAVPFTSTYALTNVTLPYVLELGGRGARAACEADPSLARGVNVARGMVTSRPVADAHGMEAADWWELLS